MLPEDKEKSEGKETEEEYRRQIGQYILKETRKQADVEMEKN